MHLMITIQFHGEKKGGKKEEKENTDNIFCNSVLIDRFNILEKANNLLHGRPL